MTFCILGAKLPVIHWVTGLACELVYNLGLSQPNRRSRQIPMSSWGLFSQFYALIFRKGQDHAGDSYGYL
jgi:hypothetical protein